MQNDIRDYHSVISTRHPNDRYAWREGFGSPARAADPTAIGLHIEKLGEDSEGIVSTDRLVIDSDNPESPLYNIVERDIEVAAHQWRKQEVTGIVGALVIVRVEEAEKDEEPQTVVVRAFPNVVGENERGYSSTYFVATRPDLNEQVKNQLRREAARWAKKAREYDEFSAVVQAIESTLAEAQD